MKQWLPENQLKPQTCRIQRPVSFVNERHIESVLDGRVSWLGSHRPGPLINVW